MRLKVGRFLTFLTLCSFVTLLGFEGALLAIGPSESLLGGMGVNIIVTLCLAVGNAFFSR